MTRISPAEWVGSDGFQNVHPEGTVPSNRGTVVGTDALTVMATGLRRSDNVAANCCSSWRMNASKKSDFCFNSQVETFVGGQVVRG